MPSPSFSVPPPPSRRPTLTASGLRTHSSFLLPLLPPLLSNLYAYQKLNPAKSLAIVVTASHNPWWDAGVKVFVDGHSPSLEEISFLNSPPSPARPPLPSSSSLPLLVFWDLRFSSSYYARCIKLLYL
eukprot:CAMPEP_0182466962 /NCGR_PEP_ID=MMETSP1319-20130603/12983_1 /TAXON_ID=172717 /ORGANISM="Bolidomonas pacifica, Strain RCC208" /LENGTH=127 /DNA_ID=CAMNT_0024667009 /DNA_START=93 /DNA_END=473 /DNA_ORIENTATION=-